MPSSGNLVRRAAATGFGRCREAGDLRVNMQETKGGKAKAYQVQQLLAAVDRYRAERARAAEAGKPSSKDVSAKGKKGGRRS